MKLCTGCQRHLRAPEARCPFCGSEQHSAPAGLAMTLVLGVALVACGPKEAGDSGPGTSTSDGMSTGPATGTSGSSTSPTSTGPDGGPTSTGPEPGPTSTGLTTDGSVSSTASNDEAGDEGCAFYAGCPPDVGPSPVECDVFLQDCPADEKCAAWAAEGGSSWNATKCVPAGDKQPGEVCTAEGGGVSGIDDCIKGAMCLGVDGETSQGHCVALCTGTPRDPECGPDGVCSISNEGVLNLCLPTCDPLMQDCVEGDGCLPSGDDFICVPDASDEEGQFGDPCEFVNACDPGLLCASPSETSETCDQVQGGCCTPFCVFPDGACPDPEQTCQQLKEEPIPPGEEDIGFCQLPPP